MPRSMWTGSISFGLVNVPVKLYSAVHQHDLHFNQFGPKGDRIRYKRVSEKTGKEIDYGDIRKGYELDDGKFVLLDPEELEAFEPRATRTIDIEDFVDLEDIDPIYYEHTYYLAPAESEGGAAKAYSLLLEAMKKRKKVAIGKVVIRTKQYLAAIRPMGDALALSTLLFADEVGDTSAIDTLPTGKDTASDREVKMATQIIDSLSTEWDPTRYSDTYTERVMDYIKRKAEGKDVVLPEEEPEQATVVDLMAALEASLAAAKKGGGKALAKTVKKAAEAAAEEASEDEGDDEDDDDGKDKDKDKDDAGSSPRKATAKKAVKKPAKRATKKRAATKATKASSSSEGRRKSA